MHISHQTDNTRPIIWREREREREMHISHQTDNTRPIICMCVYSLLYMFVKWYSFLNI